MGDGNIWDILVGLAAIIIFAVGVGWYVSRRKGTGRGGDEFHRSIGSGS